jgi:hypothetical protein
MLPDLTSPLLEEESARCKASLEAFTEGLIVKLALSQHEAGKLRRYDHSRIDGNMYLHFPFCFVEAFAGVVLKDVRTIALSAILWMSYMRAQDDTVDKQGAADPTFLFLRDLYLRESFRLLGKLFAHDSPFWESYSTYFYEYARAVLREARDHASVESHYDEDEFFVIAKGKAAMAKYPVAALAVLSARNEKVALLTESLDYFHVGYQYWDDLVDWKEDLTAAKYSLLLARALARVAPEERNGPPSQLRERIGYVLYYSGLAEEHLDRSDKCLERATELSLAAGCTVWAGYVKKLQQQTVALADDLRSIMARRANRSDGSVG